MKNRGSTKFFYKLSRGLPKEHPHKFEANLCSGSRDEVKNGILHSDIYSNTL